MSGAPASSERISLPCVGDLFQVVEDQQQLAAAQERVERVNALERQGFGEAVTEPMAFAHVVKRYEPRTSRKVGQALGSQLQRKPRLPHAAGADQCQQPHIVLAQQRQRFRKLSCPPDEPRRLHRQIRSRASSERSGGNISSPS